MLPMTESRATAGGIQATGGGIQEVSRTRRLRVLFVIPGEARGSSMVFALRQAAALTAHGVDVRVFHLRSRTSPRVLFGEFRRFRRELSRFQPQVVHAHFGTVTAFFSALGVRAWPRGWPWGWWSARESTSQNSSRGIPLVITYRGSDLNPAPGGVHQRLRAWLGRALSQIAALAAGRIVCVSAQLKRRLLWRRDRAVVLPSGVDPDLFYPRPRARARRRLGWGDGPVVLFNAGNDPRIKRLDVARAAAAVARRALPALRLEVLDGQCPPETIPWFMSAADCLLLTSDSEGSPTVVQEALACNLPVVSVAVGDVAERLRGVRGTRMVARDPQALGQALVEVVSRVERSDGRRKLEEFSCHRIAAELREIYGRLAGEPVPPRSREQDRARGRTSAGNQEPSARGRGDQET
jgi:glycosyltransferase involved in cell wall biosynthesis